MILVALGGALGSTLRYIVSHWINEAASSPFPYATMLVNVLGCLLIGIFYGMAERYGLCAELKLLLTVGLCGGFTTFSTFMNENLTLLRNDNFLLSAAYAGGSFMLGLVCVYLGKQIFCN